MRHFLLIISLVFSVSLSAQDYSKVRIIFDDDHSVFQLARLGVEVDHGELVLGKHLTNVYSKESLAKIHAAGFQTKMMIEDVQAHYLAKNAEAAAAGVENRNDHCDVGDTGTDFEVPENFTFGSMGGYYTYQEMLDILDDMAAQYPNLISQRAPIGDVLTHEDRPIYWLRVSDNPNVDEDEPEVL